MKKKPLVVVGILLICSGPLIVLTGVSYTLMLPNLYVSRVRISVQEEAPQVIPFDSGTTNYPTYNPLFLRTQFEIIQSKPILYEVIKRLNLQKEWGMAGERLPRDVTLKILKNSIDVYQLRDTSLIVISVKRDNPDEAAMIANEQAATYRDSRLALEERKLRVAVEKFDEALAEQQQRVNDAEEQVRQLRENSGASLYVDDLQLEQIRIDLLTAQQKRVENQTKLKKLEKIGTEDLFVVAGRFAEEPMIGNLLTQSQNIEARLDETDESFGPNHPEVARLIHQKEQIQKVLLEQLLALQSRYQTEYELASGREEKLNELLLKIEPKSDGNSESQQALKRAMAELENERFIADQLKARLRTQIVILEVPRSPVEIIDVAEPNRRPVSPNFFLNTVVALVLGAFVAATGIGMLVLGLRGSRT